MMMHGPANVKCNFFISTVIISKTVILKMVSIEKQESLEETLRVTF